MAPVLFALIIGCILLFLANITFDHEALGKLLNSMQWPLGMIVHALLIILTIVLIILFIITPALTAFLVNLKRPVLKSWGKALLSGIMFFMFCVIAVSIATNSLKPHDAELTQYELAQYKLLLVYGLLCSSLLSLSVLLFGRLGSSLGIKRREHRLPDS